MESNWRMGIFAHGLTTYAAINNYIEPVRDALIAYVLDGPPRWVTNLKLKSDGSVLGFLGAPDVGYIPFLTTLLGATDEPFPYGLNVTPDT